MAVRPLSNPITYGTIVGTAPMSDLDTSFGAVFTSGFNDSSLGWMNYAADIGSANNYAVTLPSAPSAYNAGMCVSFLPSNSNTGPSVINVNSLGTQSIRDQGGNILVGGSIVAGVVCTVIFNGTNFMLVNPGIQSSAVNGIEPGMYNGAFIREDFNAGTSLWSTSATGAGAVFISVTSFSPAGLWTNGGCGVVGGSTGSTTSGTSGAFLPGGVYPAFGACNIECRFYLNQLPTSGQNFIALVGLVDVITTPSQAVLLGVVGSQSLTQWTGQCVSGSTFSVSGGAVTANAYHKLSIQINSTWTSVNFIVDGTSIGTLTSGIPGASSVIFPGMYILKIGGTTNVQFYADTYFLNYQYSR